jgi:hypothetical protein
MNGGTASEAQRWDEGAKRPKGLKGQACLLPELTQKGCGKVVEKIGREWKKMENFCLSLSLAYKN